MHVYLLTYLLQDAQSSSPIVTTNKPTPSFYRPDAFLSLNHQCQSTSSVSVKTVIIIVIIIIIIIIQEIGRRTAPVLLKLRMMEVMVTTGAIRCAKLQSNHHHQ